MTLLKDVPRCFSFLQLLFASVFNHYNVVNNLNERPRTKVRQSLAGLMRFISKSTFMTPPYNLVWFARFGHSFKSKLKKLSQTKKMCTIKSSKNCSMQPERIYGYRDS